MRRGRHLSVLPAPRTGAKLPPRHRHLLDGHLPARRGRVPGRRHYRLPAGDPARVRVRRHHPRLPGVLPDRHRDRRRRRLARRRPGRADRRLLRGRSCPGREVAAVTPELITSLGTLLVGIIGAATALILALRKRITEEELPEL